MDKQGFVSDLINEASKNNIFIDEQTAVKIEQFKSILLEWNEKINLTRITDSDDFIKKHVIDSLMVINRVCVKKDSKIIDIGTGPGIPGILIKLLRPDLHVSLLESQRKKANFIQYALEQMKLTDVIIINDRAENAAKKRDFREKYDIAVARAVSSLNVLLELCLPFVRIGGTFVAMKGEDPKQEISEAKNSIRVLKGKIEEIIDYSLDNENKRTLVLIKKIGKTPADYPRRPGIPAKKPL